MCPEQWLHPDVFQGFLLSLPCDAAPMEGLGEPLPCSEPNSWPPQQVKMHMRGRLLTQMLRATDFDSGLLLHFFLSHFMVSGGVLEGCKILGRVLLF